MGMTPRDILCSFDQGPPYVDGQAHSLFISEVSKLKAAPPSKCQLRSLLVRAVGILRSGSLRPDGRDWSESTHCFICHLRLCDDLDSRMFWILGASVNVFKSVLLTIKWRGLCKVFSRPRRKSSWLLGRIEFS